MNGKIQIRLLSQLSLYCWFSWLQKGKKSFRQFDFDSCRTLIGIGITYWDRRPKGKDFISNSWASLLHQLVKQCPEIVRFSARSSLCLFPFCFESNDCIQSELEEWDQWSSRAVIRNIRSSCANVCTPKVESQFLDCIILIMHTDRGCAKSWPPMQAGEKSLTPCRSVSGLRIVNSRITSSRLNQFLNQSYVFSKKISPSGLALRTFFDRQLTYPLTYVMHIWMDRMEQRVMVKYFFLKGHGSKFIHKELVSTLQDNAISLSILKNRLKRFKSCDFSCGDDD
jgi:hypothetical protein